MNKFAKFLKFICFLFLVACVARPSSEAYKAMYQYIEHVPKSSWSESPYYLVFLVNARHLDYTDCRGFLRTVAKHPSDGSKNGDVGHAWIYLKGDECIEGGHSGERGIWQPRYMDGMIDNLCYGSENPVSYLWCSQCDGFFQVGNGGHRPTFAAKVDLTYGQYRQIVEYIRGYPFSEYAITGRQCATFVSEIAGLIGIDLEVQVALEIDQWLDLDGCTYQMWENPKYHYLKFSSPDRLEQSLMQLVQQGKAENALNWYVRTHRLSLQERMQSFLKTIGALPARLQRYQQMQDYPVSTPSNAVHCPHR